MVHATPPLAVTRHQTDYDARAASSVARLCSVSERQTSSSNEHLADIDDRFECNEDGVAGTAEVDLVVLEEFRARIAARLDKSAEPCVNADQHGRFHS